MYCVVEMQVSLCLKIIVLDWLNILLIWMNNSYYNPFTSVALYISLKKRIALQYNDKKEQIDHIT